MRNESHILMLSVIFFATCPGSGQKAYESGDSRSIFNGSKSEVKLMMLDPEHFHAAIMQKTIYCHIA